eukprot:1383203-Rhodomonas_salina.1
MVLSRSCEESYLAHGSRPPLSFQVTGCQRPGQSGFTAKLKQLKSALRVCVLMLGAGRRVTVVRPSVCSLPCLKSRCGAGDTRAWERNTGARREGAREELLLILVHRHRSQLPVAAVVLWKRGQRSKTLRAAGRWTAPGDSEVQSSLCLAPR